MGKGILVCGLNGSGKSTLGKALAKELGLHFIDNEDLFFARTGEHQPYTNPRSRKEAQALFAEEVRGHDRFVFAAVRGDYAEDLYDLYQYVVLLEVPKEIRMQRVRDRSFRKFGRRMLPGGDLFAQEEAFFEFVKKRPEDYVRKWVESLKCPVIRLDGTKTTEENIAFIKAVMNGDVHLHFAHLDKSETAQVLPALFAILHENMSEIAPTGNSYDEDLAQWYANVLPAMEKPQRQIVLFLDGAEIIGYFQYYVNGGVFMMEEIQLRKAYHGTGVFGAFYRWLLPQLPADPETVQAYAHKENAKSQGILSHLGLTPAGENENGRTIFYRGEYAKLRERYR